MLGTIYYLTLCVLCNAIRLMGSLGSILTALLFCARMRKAITYTHAPSQSDQADTVSILTKPFLNTLREYHGGHECLYGVQ